MTIKKALILAAGNGTRINCKDLPKHMFDVNGKPVLERTLTRLSDAGIGKALISVNFKKEKIIDHFGDRFRGVEIEYKSGRETIGLSIVEALSGVDEPVFCVYGDTLSDYDFRQLETSHQQGGKILTAVGVPLQNTKSFGLLRHDPQKMVFKFIVKHARWGQEEPGMVDSGNFVINPEAWRLIREHNLDSIDSLLLKLNEEGGFHVHLHEGRWIDLNYPEYYERAKEMFKE